MEKQKTRKGIQRFAFLCSIFIMAFLFALTTSKEAKAKGRLQDQCSLQSVTIEVDGKEYVCDGSLKDIPVDPNVAWKDFVKKIKITDYKVLMDDCCSHVDGHDSITAYVTWWENTSRKWVPFYTYEDDGNGGTDTYTEVEENLNDSYYLIRFCLDGNTGVYTQIFFTKDKECQISYELNGGSFPEGLDVSYTCQEGRYLYLRSPVKSGSQFKGWTVKGQEDSGYHSGYCWDGTEEPPTFVANWDDSSKPIDISNATIKYLKPEYKFREGGIRPDFDIIYGVDDEGDDNDLDKGRDYFVTYKNNDKVAAADSTNPPTIIITGIGKYTGTVIKTFSIIKADVRLVGRLSLIKGKPLSSVDLSDVCVYYSYYYGDKVEGTFSWENGNYIPENAEVGDVLENDSESGETHYNLIFTPDNEDCYNSRIFTNEKISVKQGTIADCSVTFAPDQNYQYTGQEIKPEVIVKDGDVTLREEVDYEVSYAGYINVAGSTDKYAPTVTIRGIGNYIGTRKLTYAIEKATPYIATGPAATAITYGQTLDDSLLSGGVVQYSESDGTVLEGTFTWKEATVKPTVADSGKTKYTVVFTPTNKNFDSVKTDITLTVNKAETAPNKPESTMNVYKTTVKAVALPAGWIWQDTDKTKALTVGEPVTVTAVYNGADKGNYVTESVEITITRLECTHAVTEVRNAKSATCTEKGYTGDTYCVACEERLNTGTETGALGHNFATEFTVDKEPTCTTVGSKSKHCSRCAEKTEVTEIAKTDHTWDAGKVTKKATETAEGVKTYTCTVCGETKTEAIPKKAAVTPDTSTKATNTPKSPKKGDVVKDDKGKAKYKITDVKKKEVAYKAPVNKKAKTVTIPATVKINGVTYKVTGIANSAFKGNKKVTKITVGSNIKSIGNNTFSGCKKLKTIKIKSTKLTSKMVSKNAFKGLTKVTTINVPKKKLKAYKKLFKRKGLSSKVKVKGY